MPSSFMCFFFFIFDFFSYIFYNSILWLKQWRFTEEEPTFVKSQVKDGMQYGFEVWTLMWESVLYENASKQQ